MGIFTISTGWPDFFHQQYFDMLCGVEVRFMMIHGSFLSLWLNHAQNPWSRLNLFLPASERDTTALQFSLLRMQWNLLFQDMFQKKKLTHFHFDASRYLLIKVKNRICPGWHVVTPIRLACKNKLGALQVWKKSAPAYAMAIEKIQRLKPMLVMLLDMRNFIASMCETTCNTK